MSTVLEKEENPFLRLNLKESFIVLKRSVSWNDIPTFEKTDCLCGDQSVWNYDRDISSI